MLAAKAHVLFICYMIIGSKSTLTCSNVFTMQIVNRSRIG